LAFNLLASPFYTVTTDLSTMISCSTLHYTTLTIVTTGVKVYVITSTARPVSEQILWQYVGRVQTPTNSMKIHTNKEANGDIQ